MSFVHRIKLLASHYGLYHQQDKLLEELHELEEAIGDHKQFPNPYTKAHVAEEMADVLVVCRQIMQIMDIPVSDIMSRANFKVNRQLWRIREGRE